MSESRPNTDLVRLEQLTLARVCRRSGAESVQHALAGLPDRGSALEIRIGRAGQGRNSGDLDDVIGTPQMLIAA